METELERLVVRLVGDGSEYQRMLNQAATSTTAAAAKVQQAASKIEGFQNSLKGFAGQALSLLGVFGLTSSLRGAFDQFSQLERGQIRLRAAVESSGQAVGPTIERYTAMADAISRTTLATKGQILQMFTQVETMGMHGEQAERVVRNSLALAGADTENAQIMLSVAAGIERGNYQLAKRLPGLRGVRDETELVRLVNARMASGMRQAEAVANTTSGRIERLGRALKGLGTDLGGIISEAITPFVEALTKAVDAFKALDPMTKKAIALVAGLAIGFMALGPAVATVGAFISSVFTPVAGVVSLIGLAISQWAASMGGIGPAWDYINERALAAWEWMRPIASALRGFFSALWDIVVATFSAVWEFITSVWTSIFSSAEINWQGVQETIVNAILFAEFTLRNFRTVAEFVWTSIKYGLMSAVDFMKDGLIGFVAFCAASAMSIKEFFVSAWDAAFGDETFSNIGARMGREFDRVFGEVSAALGAGQSETTRALGRELDAQRRALSQSFDTFRTNRIQEIGETVAQALNPAPTPNSPQNQLGEAVKEAQKFDAVLRGSAEAAARIGAYLEANAVQRTPRAGIPPAALALAPANAAVVGAVGGGIAGGVGGGVFGAANATVIATLLGQIARNTGVTAARPEINVEPLGLEEEQVP